MKKLLFGVLLFASAISCNEDQANNTDFQRRLDDAREAYRIVDQARKAGAPASSVPTSALAVVESGAGLAIAGWEKGEIQLPPPEVEAAVRDNFAYASEKNVQSLDTQSIVELLAAAGDLLTLIDSIGVVFEATIDVLQYADSVIQCSLDAEMMLMDYLNSVANTVGNPETDEDGHCAAMCVAIKSLRMLMDCSNGLPDHSPSTSFEYCVSSARVVEEFCAYDTSTWDDL